MKDTQGKTATSIDSKCLQMQNSNEKLIASAQAMETNRNDYLVKLKRNGK